MLERENGDSARNLVEKKRKVQKRRKKRREIRVSRSNFQGTIKLYFEKNLNVLSIVSLFLGFILNPFSLFFFAALVMFSGT